MNSTFVGNTGHFDNEIDFAGSGVSNSSRRSVVRHWYRICRGAGFPPHWVSTLSAHQMPVPGHLRTGKGEHHGALWWRRSRRNAPFSSCVRLPGSHCLVRKGAIPTDPETFGWCSLVAHEAFFPLTVAGAISQFLNALAVGVTRRPLAVGNEGSAIIFPFHVVSFPRNRTLASSI